MPQVGLWLLVHVFSAVLPPVDLEEEDYYKTLGVRKRTKASKIELKVRKAYKTKSLALHPDKIAQRGGTKEDAEKAAAQYERVQEAYNVLVDSKKRQRYHALQCSPARYRFVFGKSSMMSPTEMIENLGAASVLDKLRLVLVMTLLLLLIWLQPILIAEKVNAVLKEEGALENSSWVAVLVPFWIFYSVYIGFWLAVFSFMSSSDSKRNVILKLLEDVCWFVGVLLLALAWDGQVSPNYPQIFIPIYIATLLRWIQACLLLKKIRADQNRMCTVEYLQEVILEGKDLEDLTEEEREKILEEWIIITVPDDFEFDQSLMPSRSEEEDTVEHDNILRDNIEVQKVEASPENDAASELYATTFNDTLCSIIFVSIFLILLLLKLDGVIDASWWAVFAPWWVWLGGTILFSMCRCVCGTVRGNEIMLEVDADPSYNENNDEGAPAPATNADEGDQTNSGGKKLNDEKDRGTSASDFGSTVFVDPAESMRIPDLPSIRVGSKEESESKSRCRELDLAEQGSSVDRNSKSGDSGNTGNGDSARDDDDDDGNSGNGYNARGGDDGVHIDEDTFRAWESAHEKMEQSAMQEMAKSVISCCVACFQLVIICLIVAKLDASYRDEETEEEDDDDDVGFNAFWILFPFMLIFGFIWCCCCCLICTAGAFSEDTAEDSGSVQVDADPARSGTESGAVITPPPPVEAIGSQNQNKTTDENPTEKPSVVAPSAESLGTSEEAPAPAPEANIEDID